MSDEANTATAHAGNTAIDAEQQTPETPETPETPDTPETPEPRLGRRTRTQDSPGRPTKFNTARANKILDALRMGTSRQGAIAIAGIHYQTFLRWLQSNANFAKSVEAAESELEKRLAATILTAALPHDVIEETQMIDASGVILSRKRIIKREFDWRAGESLLKRRFKGNGWGDQLDIRQLSNEQIIAALNAETMREQLNNELPASDYFREDHILQGDWRAPATNQADPPLGIPDGVPEGAA